MENEVTYRQCFFFTLFSSQLPTFQVWSKVPTRTRVSATPFCATLSAAHVWRLSWMCQTAQLLTSWSNCKLNSTCTRKIWPSDRRRSSPTRLTSWTTSTMLWPNSDRRQLSQYGLCQGSRRSTSTSSKPTFDSSSTTPDQNEAVSLWQARIALKKRVERRVRYNNCEWCDDCQTACCDWSSTLHSVAYADTDKQQPTSKYIQPVCDAPVSTINDFTT